jgi:hypothetical protein
VPGTFAPLLRKVKAKFVVEVAVGLGRKEQEPDERSNANAEDDAS